MARLKKVMDCGCIVGVDYDDSIKLIYCKRHQEQPVSPVDGELELTPEEMMPYIRGELENFAKDIVENFQKTGLVYSDSLIELFSERIVTRLAKAVIA